jgi:hypothetical protein
MLISKTNSKVVAIKVMSFSVYWFIGYFFTFVSKWFVVAAFTDYNVVTEVRNQLIHRSSQDTASLSDGVLQHLEFAKSFPAFIQSWIANISTLMIHVLDPRYSAKIVFYLVLILIAIFVLYVFFTLLINLPSSNSLVRFALLFNFLSFIFLFAWYAFLAQHSFDHATYTYRSLVFWIGGLLGTVYLLKTKNLKS